MLDTESHRPDVATPARLRPRRKRPDRPEMRRGWAPSACTGCQHRSIVLWHLHFLISTSYPSVKVRAPAKAGKTKGPRVAEAESFASVTVSTARESASESDRTRSSRARRRDSSWAYITTASRLGQGGCSASTELKLAA